MVYLNLQIQSIAAGLIAAGYSLGDLPAEALVAVSPTAPTTPNTGQMWLSTATNALSIYNGVTWDTLGLTSAEKTTLAALSGNVYTKAEVDAKDSALNNKISLKQDALVSGTNIKTVNGTSILGTGNVLITTPMGFLNDLQDATLTVPTLGQVLSYSGTEWVNTTPITSHTGLSNIGTNTHAQIDTALTRLANTSGTNTGDETVTTIKTALGITTLSGSNTGDQDLSGYSLTTHNHLGTYEPVIAVKNTGFNLNTGTTAGTLALGDHNHTGTYEPADATILKNASIGVSVQGYDANTAKLNVAQTFTPAQRGSINTITYGTTITPDFAVANNFECALTGNVIIANPTNIVAGQKGSITLRQDATGTRTTAWGTYFKFAGGTAPTYVTTANSETTFDYSVESSTEIRISPFVDWK